MLWGVKSRIMLICYRCGSMDGEVKAAFSRRSPTKHFSAQLDVKMYGFVYVLEWPTSRAQSVKKKFSRSASCVFATNRQPLLFH